MSTSPPVEFWAATANLNGTAAALARDAEALGFDGLTLSDTPCQTADPIVGLALAAGRTQRLGLGLGVTNPVTRHPSVLAASMATVQLASNGRAVLGIGRGDSAVTKVGLKAASVDQFERYLARVQAYLSGRDVEQDGPSASIAWLPDGSTPKVPLDVAASGPRTIAAGARVAERVTFNVGADPARVARCIDVARDARAAAHREVADLSFGLYLNVAPLHDASVARELVKPVVAVYLRFSGNGGRAVDGVDACDAKVIETVVANYDMARHGQGDASHLAYLDDGFVDRFSIADTPTVCIERLAALADLGIRRFILVGPAHDGDPDLVAESRRQLSQVVLPGVRSALSRS